LTNATIDEHREQAIKTGRKHKYPFQPQKHKILINALIISFVVIVLFVIFAWFMLFKAQTIGDFFYTAMRALPVPVASFDGEPVNYSDYMRRVRGSVYFLEKQDNRDFSTEDGQNELEHTRRYSMIEAERVAYANKIAREHGLAVTNDEIDANIRGALRASGSGEDISEAAYESSLRRYYGWSMNDYRQIVRDRLILRQAQFVVDAAAKERAESILAQLQGGADFATLAKAQSDDEATKAAGGDVGTINVGDLDANGLIAVAQGLTKGQLSGLIEGIDAYYVIRLIDKNDSAVHYTMIKVSLTEFNRHFEELRATCNVREYIELPDQLDCQKPGFLF
jgi:hypothetical protein